MYDLVTTTFRTPRGHPAVMTTRQGTNDWNTLNACMTEDEYELRDRTFTGTAIDIGGYLGGVGIGLALDNPDLHVVIVEPVPPNASLIRQNIAHNDLEHRVTLVESAAGGPGPVSVWYGYRGNETAEHHAFVGNSTLAYDNSGELDHDEVIYDDPWSLTRLVGDGVDLVKIDCEGGEWSILDDPAVSKVKLLLGEWHPVRGHTQADLLALLERTHEVAFSGPEEGPGGFVAVLR